MVKIALAGNPNSGKTTLFNALTGSNQYVGNWPGVTVEKKEGKLKGHKDVVITDLPGIYSLSPYTLEEVVARNYLINEKPDAIINIVDGTNIERNLYLSTQLLELGIPVIIAINMVDVLEKTGDKIYIEKLSEKLGCEVVEISALKGSGILKVAEKAVGIAHTKVRGKERCYFSENVEAAIAEISSGLESQEIDEYKRFISVKLLERDDKIKGLLQNVPEVEDKIVSLEKEFDDDIESIITNERYLYVTSIIEECFEKNKNRALTTSDKIDQIVTNRWLSLPIFALVMFIVYYISVTTVGTAFNDFVNEKIFGEGFYLFGNTSWFIPSIPDLVSVGLDTINCAEWLRGLIVDGMVAGVGAVLGFIPQMLVLFVFLAFLEGCGYMARVAFIMDRIFRKFGLSGKSFIPMLVGSGCGVTGIMASRTIESDRDRKMTIMTTTFVPCSAKLPIIAMIAGAFFGNSGLISTSAYFVGIAAIILSGIILKKTKMFSGDPAPFVMELPAYHMPTIGSILQSMWERGWSFVKKAGTIILLSTIILWFLMSFGWVDGRFVMLEAEQLSASILAKVGSLISWMFIPLGWTTSGDGWKMAVSAVTGLIAKENVVATFGMLYGFAEVAEDGAEIWGRLSTAMSPIAAYGFLIFNLLCAPCFAAMGAIKREMNNAKWFWFAIGYQCGFAYAVSLCIYQVGNLITGGGFNLQTVVALIVVVLFGFLLFRPMKKDK